MRAALIENGIVINVSLGEAAGYIDCGDDVAIGWTYDGSSFSAPVVVSPPLSMAKAQASMSSLYDRSMAKLRNGYTQEEVNTFYPKGEAARAHMNGASDALDRVTLAKIEGIINGVLPSTSAEIDVIDSAFTAGDLARIQERAEKIIDARITYQIYSGEIERLRNIRWAELSDSGDNQPVVDTLIADYAALEAS